MFKLELLGITGKLLLWIAAFLRGRSQVVRVGRSTSSSICVVSGVPQGSVLGPLLFIVYINDIVDIFDEKVQVKLFADDVKIYVVIDDISDCEILQNCLNKLYVWADCWQLGVNVKKCSTLHLGVDRINFHYDINGIQVPDVLSVSDLGVVINHDLKFGLHIRNFVSRAHQRASLILRCFKSRDPVTLCRAFTVYVRPLVEYCSQVWSPVNVTDICKIERVQRRFTRCLKGMKTMSYAERLQRLKLETLELRRLKFDLILVFKVMRGLICLPSDIFVFADITHCLRGHNCKLKKPAARINCRKNIIGSRIVDCWNCLPQSAIDAPNVVEFKRLLDCFNFASFLHVS